MNPRRMWTEPEYRHRPLQILLRLARARWRPQRALVTLPWGVKLEVRPRDAIGVHIWLRGVFDLPVTETLWRLATPGGVAADVGANIGYMTSILAARGAVVHAFEPCPPALEELRRNVARWPGARVTVHPLALTDRVGRLHMVVPPPDAANLGLAAIGPGDIEVEASTLDRVLGGVSELGILKLDVEGHEVHVLKGSAASLAAGVIRDIVFEEHRPVPSPVTELLARHGYRIFSPELRRARAQRQAARSAEQASTCLPGPELPGHDPCRGGSSAARSTRLVQPQRTVLMGLRVATLSSGLGCINRGNETWASRLAEDLPPLGFGATLYCRAGYGLPSKDGLAIGTEWCSKFPWVPVLASFRKGASGERWNRRLPLVLGPSLPAASLLRGQRTQIRGPYFGSPAEPCTVTLGVGNFSSASRKRLDSIVQEVSQLAGKRTISPAPNRPVIGE